MNNPKPQQRSSSVRISSDSKKMAKRLAKKYHRPIGYQVDIIIEQAHKADQAAGSKVIAG